MSGRREFLKWMAAAAVASSGCKRGDPSPPDAAVAGFPEKASDLILLTDRPPNLETPLHYFRKDVTPNDAFFVRWHLADLPKVIDLRSFRLSVGGHVARPLSLSVDELSASYPVTSVVAVNQCSGNSRSLFEPRVTGVQWKLGALGNARWTGVRLRDLLERAGIKAGAVDVTFAGLDKAPIDTVAPYVKSLSAAHAQDGEAIVAYAMNDAPLPMLNGFPLRLVVPGYYSTYWVKALERITVLDKPFDGYWMAKAYRVPTAKLADEAPSALASETVPISRLNVRSLVVRPEPSEELKVGRVCELEGIAFDSGSGIAKVEVSTDGGLTWGAARLDAEIGRYSFQRWRASWTPAVAGPAVVMARATTAVGEEQRPAPGWNRAGYMRNVVERVDVTVVS